MIPSRGDSFSPFASRPLRNRFAHYPPPPGEEDPSVANDPQRSSVDGEDASSGSTHQDGEESEEDNVPADAAAQRPLAGNVIPDVAQELDEDVVFDGVDGELVVAHAEAEQPFEGGDCRWMREFTSNWVICYNLHQRKLPYEVYIQVRQPWESGDTIEILLCNFSQLSNKDGGWMDYSDGSYG